MHCRDCAFYKEVKLGEGICQSPQEAKTRGMAHGSGWRRVLDWRECITGDFRAAAANKEQE